MVLAVILIAILLSMAWHNSATTIHRANEEVKARDGDEYDPALAARPARDGCIIVAVVVVLIALAMPLLGQVLPLLP